MYITYHVHVYILCIYIYITYVYARRDVRSVLTLIDVVYLCGDEVKYKRMYIYLSLHIYIYIKVDLQYPESHILIEIYS